MTWEEGKEYIESDRERESVKRRVHSKENNKNEKEGLKQLVFDADRNNKKHRLWFSLDIQILYLHISLWVGKGQSFYRHSFSGKYILKKDLDLAKDQIGP